MAQNFLSIRGKFVCSALSLALVAGGLAAPAQGQQASSIAGVWYDHTGDGAVELAACGNRMCGRIVWLRNPLNAEGRPLRDKYNPNATLQNRPICGLQILRDLQPLTDGSWGRGIVYDPKKGAENEASVKPGGAGKVVLTGYGLFGLSKSFEWSRAPDDLPRCDGKSAGQPAANPATAAGAAGAPATKKPMAAPVAPAKAKPVEASTTPAKSNAATKAAATDPKALKKAAAPAANAAKPSAKPSSTATKSATAAPKTNDAKASAAKAPATTASKSAAKPTATTTKTATTPANAKPAAKAVVAAKPNGTKPAAPAKTVATTKAAAPPKPVAAAKKDSVTADTASAQKVPTATAPAPSSSGSANAYQQPSAGFAPLPSFTQP